MLDELFFHPNIYSLSRGRGQNDRYEPLAQVRTRTNEDSENRQETHYFHRDQIGIPREMTDKDGSTLKAWQFLQYPLLPLNWLR